AYSALPCAGAPPPQRPRPFSRRSENEGNVTVSARGGRASPRPPPVGQALYLPICHLVDGRQAISATTGTIPSPDLSRPNIELHANIPRALTDQALKM
ncbi:MAG: hypothetical protein OXF54_10440, partial [Caldilineaceae bacterium]|nr:hypothetical protein [Caldilineaceae bacterium]